MVIVFVTTEIALYHPFVTIFFYIVGGFCGSIMALIVPACMYIKLSGQPILHWWNVLVFIVAIGLSAVAIASVFIN